VFRDLVSLNIIPKIKLRFTHRFTGTIAENANKINNGIPQLQQDDDFKIIKAETPEERQTAILKEYYKALREAGGDYKSVQIIVPQRQRGASCANELNKIIRESLNPKMPGSITFGKAQFRKGDRVMQIRNNSTLKVANGDCGIIVDIDEQNSHATILMDSGEKIDYSSCAAEDLVLAYAITVHKSQGSEYNTVISAYGKSDYIMLQRNLLYTAVTRAKSKMIMICDNTAIRIAVNNIKPIVRNTSLKERILSY
jgi:exodeoxyribonuclease V alpha subunit